MSKQYPCRPLCTLHLVHDLIAPRRGNAGFHQRQRLRHLVQICAAKNDGNRLHAVRLHRCPAFVQKRFFSTGKEKGRVNSLRASYTRPAADRTKTRRRSLAVHRPFTYKHALERRHQECRFDDRSPIDDVQCRQRASLPAGRLVGDCPLLPRAGALRHTHLLHASSDRLRQRL